MNNSAVRDLDLKERRPRVVNSRPQRLIVSNSGTANPGVDRDALPKSSSLARVLFEAAGRLVNK